MVDMTGGFFSKPAPAKNETKVASPVFINVGGEQFHAAAVALIGELHHNLNLKDDILKKIIANYFHYFPQALPDEAYLTTPRERIRRLLNNPRTSELVERIAYVLRQLAVDELYTNPLNLDYREIFLSLKKDTPLNYLRDVRTSLPLSIFNALAQALNISIILSFKELGKELRKCEQMGDSNCAVSLLIQVQDQQYYPAVKQKNEFTHVGKLKIAITPIKQAAEKQGDLEDIFNLITEANESLLHVFKQQRHKILCMVNANELSREQLIELYCSLLPEQTRNADFLIHLAQIKNPVIAGTPVDLEQETIKSLADAFASWIATGAITQEQLFESDEHSPSMVISR